MFEANKLFLGELRIPGLHDVPHLFGFILVLIDIFRHAVFAGRSELFKSLLQVLLIQLVRSDHLDAVFEGYISVHIFTTELLLHHLELIYYFLTHTDNFERLTTAPTMFEPPFSKTGRFIGGITSG